VRLGVVDEVRERACQERCVGHHLRRPRLDDELRRRQARPLERATPRVGGVDGRPRQRRELDPRAREQLRHERVHLDDLALDLGGARIVDAALARELEQQADACQRRSYLVRHGRQELALVSELLLDLLGHPIHRVAHDGDLAVTPHAPADADTAPEVAAADVGRDARHFGEGPREASREKARAHPQDDAGEHDREEKARARSVHLVAGRADLGGAEAHPIARHGEGELVAAAGERP